MGTRESSGREKTSLGIAKSGALLVFLTLGILFSGSLISNAAGHGKSSIASGSSKPNYYPDAGEKWQHRNADEAGMDAALLKDAVDYAKTQASTIPKDFSTQVATFGRVLGPLPKERGDSSGIILRHGYIVAEWGDTLHVDPTYSAAKSFLSTLCGVAVDRGMIKSVKDPVRNYINDGGYDSAHNAKITWEEHLQQVSEWQGTMWEKPSDFIGVAEFGNGRRQPRELKEPGAFWEYNDVRINRFSLSLMKVWNRPLPQVLKTEIMDPIDASSTWHYYGYENSKVMLNGKSVESVSGGTRWGGGLWISARDMARFGYLYLRKGNWKGKQLVSENWVASATTPAAIGPDYGYLFWLNTQRKQFPSAPSTSFAALGYGSNIIWVDPEHDVVVVWRWYQDKSANEFLKRVLASVKS